MEDIFFVNLQNVNFNIILFNMNMKTILASVNALYHFLFIISYERYYVE